MPQTLAGNTPEERPFQEEAGLRLFDHPFRHPLHICPTGLYLIPTLERYFLCARFPSLQMLTMLKNRHQQETPRDAYRRSVQCARGASESAELFGWVSSVTVPLLSLRPFPATSHAFDGSVRA